MSGFDGVRADWGGRCFDALPALIDDAFAGPEPQHLVLVWVDAFGWSMVERFGDHPFLRRVGAEGSVERWTSQFPSTTTAHYVTLHSGLPVGRHGLYEWFIYEPSLDRMICPLRYSFAGDDRAGTLAEAGVEPASILPHVVPLMAGLAARGVACHSFQHAAYARSQANDIAMAGATVHPFADRLDGLAEAETVLAAADPQRSLFALVYIDTVDAEAHLHGPGSEEVAREAQTVLGGLDRLAAARGPARLLVTADHGAAAIDPATTVYVNREWPAITELLAAGADGRPLAPGGSCRDLFLHTKPGELDAVVAGLERVVGGRAQVYRTAQLLADGVFGDAGDRLRSRIGDVLVLPGPGESVWWYEPGRFEQHFRGSHGGASADEMHIPLITLG